MQARFTTAVLLGSVLIAVAACGGGSDTAKLTELEERVAAAEEARKEAEKKAAEEEQKRQDAEAEAEKVDDAEEARKEAEAELEEEKKKRQEAERRAQEQIDKQAQTLEANQRAQGLLDVLSGAAFPAATALTSFTAPPEAAVSVATRNRLTFGPSPGRSSSTRSGFRYAKVTDTFGRTRTTVMYTDRELSRKLLDHYGNSRDGTDMTRLDISDSDLGTGVTITGGAISEASMVWKINHGLRTSLAGVDHDSDRSTPRQRPADPANPSPRKSYSGNLHGKGGTFVCGGTDCQIQLTPTYAGTEADEGNQFALQTVTLANVGGTGLYFKPTGSPSIDLYEGAPVVGADTEYMVFGYWIEDPESAVGTYEVLPFAQVFEGADLATFPTSGTARYTGAAVGVYVESAPFGSTDIDKRQGDFEAGVSLTADFGGDVGGWISGFKTTPRGGSAEPRTSNWRVTLADVATAVTVTGGATIDGLGGSGSWAAQFVQARENAASAEPPAIVGVFNTSGPSLHLVGAFGAKQ